MSAFVPTITAYAFYEYGHRSLEVSLRGVTGYFRWNPPRSAEPAIRFSWSNGPAKPGQTDCVSLVVLPTAGTATVGWREPSVAKPEWRWEPRHAVIPLPVVDWTDLLQIARFVAAGRADKMTILGWIEDNLPEPWNLFATPTPKEALRALCPFPLCVPVSTPKE